MPQCSTTENPRGSVIAWYGFDETRVLIHKKYQLTSSSAFDDNEMVFNHAHAWPLSCLISILLDFFEYENLSIDQFNRLNSEKDYRKHISHRLPRHLNRCNGKHALLYGQTG